MSLNQLKRCLIIIESSDDMRIGAVVQARIGSTRLPGKVLLNLDGKTVLEHVVERIKLSKRVDEVIIATTVLEKDDKIEALALEKGWEYYRGSEDDVLSRYYEAAEKYKLEVIVRITSDCPLIDAQVIDTMIDIYTSNKYDIVTNAGADLSNRTFPRGLDVEIFSLEILKKAYINGKENYQREHVTPYIYERSSNIYYHRNDIDYSSYRWTLDTEEDWELISSVYKHLYHGIHDFFLQDIIELMKKRLDVASINAHIEQKKIK